MTGHDAIHNADPRSTTQSYGAIDRIGWAFVRSFVSRTCRCGATPHAAFQWWMVVNSHGWMRARARELAKNGGKGEEDERRRRTIDGLHRNCIECIRASYWRGVSRANRANDAIACRDIVPDERHDCAHGVQPLRARSPNFRPVWG